MHAWCCLDPYAKFIATTVPAQTEKRRQICRLSGYGCLGRKSAQKNNSGHPTPGPVESPVDIVNNWVRLGPHTDIDTTVVHQLTSSTSSITGSADSVRCWGSGDRPCMHRCHGRVGGSRMLNHRWGWAKRMGGGGGRKGRRVRRCRCRGHMLGSRMRQHRSRPSLPSPHPHPQKNLTLPVLLSSRHSPTYLLPLASVYVPCSKRGGTRRGARSGRGHRV